MRILQLHCDFVEFTPIKKEIQSAEEIELDSVRLEEIVVAFVAVEEGDNSDVAKRAITQISDSMKKIGCNKLLLYPYAHISPKLASPTIALSLLREMESRIDGLEIHRAPFGWTKSYKLQVKGHPLAENSKTISPIEEKESSSDALRAESKIKSFWHIMTIDGQLYDVDKFDFTKYGNLEVLSKYEVAKKRSVDEYPPHVKLMKKLAIADYEPASDAGNMRFFPNGRLIKSLIERYITEKVMEYGGLEVETPIMYDSHHPSMESYFHRFPARQYSINSEGKQLFLRFAACFGQFLMAKNFQLSYKNLPLKLYELTRYSFRREQSGELVGLRRLRAFTMPDCHALCKDMDQAKEEILKRFDLSQVVINGLGLEPSEYEMAIRFTEEFYSENKSLIEELVKKIGKPVLVETWKERFFYFVLKWEFNFVDNLGKASALSTDQIDVENGKRYNIEFIDEHNVPQNPIILHNSPSGAVERVIYVLLEKAANDQKQGRKPTFPLWLGPTQVRLIPVKPDFLDHCEKLADKLTENNIRVDVDDRNESVGKSIRDGETEWIRFIIVIGEKELNSLKLNIRDRKSKDVRNLTIEELISEIKEETRDKPFMRLNNERHLTKRPQIMV
jgi:threonyl-tRNA synthetase